MDKRIYTYLNVFYTYLMTPKYKCIQDYTTNSESSNPLICQILYIFKRDGFYL